MIIKLQKIITLTLVYVSRDTMKNPLPVRQQGTLDLIMTRIKSFHIILPLEIIDNNAGQGPPYDAIVAVAEHEQLAQKSQYVEAED